MPCLLFRGEKKLVINSSVCVPFSLVGVSLLIPENEAEDMYVRTMCGERERERGGTLKQDFKRARIRGNSICIGLNLFSTKKQKQHEKNESKISPWKS